MVRVEVTENRRLVLLVNARNISDSSRQKLVSSVATNKSPVSKCL